jgi:hypothetical protein
MEKIRLCGVEGTIALGLGDHQGAEQAFQAARQAFAAEGLFPHSAVLGLHLANLWFRQGKTAQVQGIVGELVTVFSRVQVEREALAALVLLQKSILQDRVTLELIEKVQGVFGQIADGRGKKSGA